ncbi:MAG: hypothetical protein ACRC41_15085 [Sarcina sp.]
MRGKVQSFTIEEKKLSLVNSISSKTNQYMCELEDKILARQLIVKEEILIKLENLKAVKSNIELLYPQKYDSSECMIKGLELMFLQIEKLSAY